MEDERDFVWIVGKVPTRDKEGIDITGDNLSAGGLRRDDGTLSGMAYDLEILDDGDGTSTEYDHVQHYQSEDESGSPRGLIALAILAAAAATGAAIAAPRIKSWCQEKVLPSMKRRWARKGDPALFATDEARSQAATAELATLSKTARADFSNAIDVALEDCRTSMSSEEAQRRLAAMLAAAAFFAEQVRMLSNARLEDDADFPELKSAMEKLTTQQVTDSINRMLEANTSLLDEETSAEFMRIFGGGRVVDGEYVPLRNERVKEALRLTNSEMPPM